jgi:hypothetical protein
VSETGAHPPADSRAGTQSGTRPATSPAQPVRPAGPSRARTAASVVAGMIIAFAIGYGWQFIRASRLERELERTRQELAVQKIEATLGVATVEAQRGAFEPARQLASEFYTRLQEVRENADEARRPEIDAILGERDATITALSRSDAQSGAILGNTLMRLRGALGEGGGASTVATPAAQPSPQ